MRIICRLRYLLDDDVICPGSAYTCFRLFVFITAIQCYTETQNEMVHIATRTLHDTMS